MGNCNCLDFSRGASWADDNEWDLPEQEEKKIKNKKRKQEEENKMEADEMTAPTEVKIKLSKKQLEKLLEQADAKDLPMHDLLVELVKLGQPQPQPCHTIVPEKDCYWRPRLQTIPELLEQ